MSFITIKHVRRAAITTPIVLFAVVGVCATTERTPLSITVPSGTDDGGSDHAFPWIPAFSKPTPGGH